MRKTLKENTKTKKATNLDFDFGPEVGGEVSTQRRSASVDAQGDPLERPGRQTGAKPNIRSMDDPRAAGWLSDLANMDVDDEVSDDDARRTAGVDNQPRTPENLPAIMSRAIANTGGEFEPNWYMVKNLPGYMQKAIRAIGRQIFSPYTDTPLEDIQVMSTLSNDDNEVKMMANWIRRNGARDDEAEMNFDQTMQGYAAQVQIWSTLGYQFMIVKDPMGYYIYSWPGGRGVHVGRNNKSKMIGEKKLNENTDNDILKKYKQQGWMIYHSKMQHRSRNDRRFEFEKDDVEFEIIGSPGSWELYINGPTLSGKGKMFKNLKTAIEYAISVKT